MSSREPPKTVAGRILALVLGCFATLIAAEFIVRIAWPQWKEYDFQSLISRINVEGFGSVEIGRPGFNRYISDRGGEYRFHVHINEYGHRQTEPITTAHGRIWVIGDSQSFGWGVADDQTYSAALGRLLGIPTYNLASPARNVCDHRMIVGRIPKNIQPRAVVLGLVPERVMHGGRCLNRASPHAEQPSQRLLQISTTAVDTVFIRYSALYATISAATAKAILARAGRRTQGIPLQKRPAPVQAAEPNDVTAIALRVADDISALREMLPHGVPIVVLIGPGQEEFLHNDLASKAFRSIFATALQDRQLAFADLREQLKPSETSRKFFFSDGQWSELGHLAIAQGLADNFKRRTVPDVQ